MNIYYKDLNIDEIKGAEDMRCALSMMRLLYGDIAPTPAAPPAAAPQAAPAASDPASDVVVIYDDFGIPSIMRRFRRMTNRELFGGTDTVHPAFIIGGEVYDEIYISVYENCSIDGRMYSLPYKKPCNNITLDDAENMCFNKGEGWHLMTAAEWGLLANLCLRNGTLLHGNNCRGGGYAGEQEQGVCDDKDCYITLTGSGPVTWTHDHTPFGVHGLCGNVWEWLRGLRIKDGHLEIAPNNDAAMPIDLSADSGLWKLLRDNNGAQLVVSVDDDVVTVAPKFHIEISSDFGGGSWRDADICCDSEVMKALALYCGEPDACFYVDASDGEWCLARGGRYSSGSYAGVFAAALGNSRSYSSASTGGRSAFYRKLETGN